MHATHINTKIVHIVAAICVAFTLTGCNAEDEIRPSHNVEPKAPSTVRGSFDIYYSIQTSETTGEGTGNTPEKATAIHFYDEYIVVEYSTSSRIFPIRKINSFRWTSNQ
ncbi:MAG: hypothetical protein ACYSWW_05810 [Planctomycetota bacterium]|jgi:hypothetical protein